MANEHKEDVIIEEAAAVEVQSFEDKAQTFLQENQKLVTAGLAIIIVLIGGFVFFKSYYLPKQNKAAQEAMMYAEHYFKQQDFEKALNGSGDKVGFIEVADDYSITKAGKLASYYAGLSNLHLGNYEEAVKYLKNFQTSDPVIAGLALAALGDAYTELGEESKGLGLYKRAASLSSNEFSSPYLLNKAGEACEQFDDLKSAKKFYGELDQKFPNSKEGRDASKKLARVNAKLKS